MTWLTRNLKYLLIDRKYTLGALLIKFENVLVGTQAKIVKIR